MPGDLILIHHEGQEAGLYCEPDTWDAAGAWLETQDAPALVRFWRRCLSTDLEALSLELEALQPPEPLVRHFAVLAAFIDPETQQGLQAEWRVELSEPSQ